MAKDRIAFDLQSLDEVGLRKIGKGKIFVVDEKQRQYFVIESQVLDYATQLNGVIAEFVRGNRETFAVSPDFFSNNLRFRLLRNSNAVEVYEVNGGSFCLTFKYMAFREAVQGFYTRLLEDLQIYYPELRNNVAFSRLLPR